MAENAEKDVQTEQKDVQDVNYVEVIQQLKANTVDKKAYEKVVRDNQMLTQALVENKQLSSTNEEPKLSEDELKKKLCSGKLNNLEYIQTSLQLRDCVIKRGARDPFLANKIDALPTEAEMKRAQEIADIYQECIDYADGDSQVFTNELMRRTVELPRIKR